MLFMLSFIMQKNKRQIFNPPLILYRYLLLCEYQIADIRTLA